MTLRIEHTETEGTLLHGTSRGDGAGQVVKALGWRWGRSIDAWYLPRSRDAAPRRPLIELTAARLREAGHQVRVQVDTTLADRAGREERIAQRAQDRIDRLEARADRQEARAGQEYAAYRQIAEHIPLGQPVLLGHHSQARAERDIDRMGARMDGAVQHQERADQARSAATSARDHQRHRHDPVTVANRVERLAADVRRLERTLAGLDAHDVPAEDAHRQRVEDQLAIDRADLEHWRGVRAYQVARGQATDYGRDSVAPGDLVKIRGHWHTVARANHKTVAVDTGHSWTDKAPWHEVQDHRPRRPAPAAVKDQSAVDDPDADLEQAAGQGTPGRGVEHQRRELPTEPRSSTVDR